MDSENKLVFLFRLLKVLIIYLPDEGNYYSVPGCLPFAKSAHHLFYVFDTIESSPQLQSSAVHHIGCVAVELFIS